MSFTDDPVASSFQTAADHAVAVGVAKAISLTGLFDVSILNQVLGAAKEAQVAGS
jgi:NitT/TauT family transport system substrate-binding protein